MARRLRFHLPDATYHVMLRGNDGQPIFFTEGDRSRLCLLIQQGVERFGYRVHAFCFMSNHIHLAIQVGDISISRIVQHLAFRYARYINRQQNRIGHLFQGRFKSILVDEDRYLKELVRYIHLNPVRAHLVSSPEDYMWSSHRAYMNRDEFTWLTQERLLKRFHHDPQLAVSNYEKYVMKGIGLESEIDFKVGCQDGVLGDDGFVDEMTIKAYAAQKQNIELPDLITKICERYELAKEDLCSLGKQRKLSRTRAILALLVRERSNLSLEHLSRFLKRDASGLSKLANRLEIECSQNSGVAKEVKEVREWIGDFT
jgi:putative transposase